MLSDSIKVIQGYIPKLYKLFNKEYVVSIDTDVEDLKKEYPNLVRLIGDNLLVLPKICKKLKYIYMWEFTGNLNPLKGVPIEEINMSRFNGDLSPLKGAPIKGIRMNSFNGELTINYPFRYIKSNVE